MRRHSRSILLCCSLALLAAAPGVARQDGAAPGEQAARPPSWAEPLPGRPGLPNLHRVSDALYRGAQPKREGFAELKAMGIRTVIDLRTGHDERGHCEEHGLQYVRIPMQAWRTEDEDTLEFLRVVTDPERQPVFLHCLHGADRAGVLTAVYRVAVQGWSKDEALREMREGGFGFHEQFQNLLHYVLELDVEAIRRRAGLPAPARPRAAPRAGSGGAAAGVILATSVGTPGSGAMTAARSKSDGAIDLPRPDTAGGMTLERALATRRSVRDYGRRPLELSELSQLLWAGQGITDRSGDRTTPSAGALFPLELIAVAGRVVGLEPGVYRYRPARHDLVRLAEGDRRADLANAALRQSWIADGAAAIVVTAVYARTMGKYGDRGMRYAHIEVGQAVQSLYLQATALNLGTCVVGAFHDDRVRELLGLPPEEEPLAILPVGEKR